MARAARAGKHRAACDQPLSIEPSGGADEGRRTGCCAVHGGRVCGASPGRVAARSAGGMSASMTGPCSVTAGMSAGVDASNEVREVARGASRPGSFVALDGLSRRELVHRPRRLRILLPGGWAARRIRATSAIHPGPQGSQAAIASVASFAAHVRHTGHPWSRSVHRSIAARPLEDHDDERYLHARPLTELAERMDALFETGLPGQVNERRQAGEAA